MTGHIQQRGAGRWRVMVFLGRDDTGRQRFASRTVRGGREAAEAVRDALAASVERVPRQERRTARPGRLPLAPLLEVARCSLSECARRVGVDERQAYRWAASGVTVWQADRLAVRCCGVVPSAVWGQAWNELADAQAVSGAA